MGTIIKGLQSVIIALGIIAVVGTGAVLYYNVVNPPSNNPAQEEAAADTAAPEGSEAADGADAADASALSEESPDGSEDPDGEGVTATVPGDEDSSASSDEGTESDSESEGSKRTGPISHEHNYIRTIGRLATCTEQGEAVYKCSICEDTYSEAIPMIDHTPGEWITVKGATATEPGLQQKYCLVCGHPLEEKELAALGGEAAQAPHHHVYTYTVSTEPTCDAEGERTYECVDGDSTYKTKIPPKNHPSRSSEVVEGDCGNPGTVKVVCGLCKAVISETEKIYPHSFSGWNVVEEPSPVTQGKKERVCSKCGKVETKVIPKLTGQAASSWMAMFETNPDVFPGYELVPKNSNNSNSNSNS